jgi:predicted Rossmann fold nucleotide-binding protein DprA/Smf involved in DNA uptake
MHKFNKIGVVGSRSFNDYHFMKKMLDNFIVKESIISGGAIGADKLAKRYAIDHSIPIKEFLPDWTRHGKAAGPIRNKIIVDNSDAIIAFWDGKSKGTKSTISIAKEQGKKVFVYWNS